MTGSKQTFFRCPLFSAIVVAKLLVILVSSCLADQEPWQPDNSSDSPSVDAARYPHLQNLQQLTERMYVGGEPQEDVAFAELAELGVRTVVSVDGAKPKVAHARHHGLRYVHIPIGYEGVSEEAGRALAQLARTIEGPIYFHCHHGKHRGPAAAAVACLAEGTINREQAMDILKRSGTSQDYAGLWRDVEQYRPPAKGAAFPKLVEVAQVDSFTAVMAQIDRSTENLKLCQASGWQPLSEHPDISPQQEALLLREGFHEAGRQLTDEQRTDIRLVNWFAAAETTALKLEDALKARQLRTASEQLQILGGGCGQCHRVYRD